jgi:hypothetical protein
VPSCTYLLFFRPRWGSRSLSSLRPRAARRSSEHPSPECGKEEQRAPFAREWQGERASCSLCPPTILVCVRPRWGSVSLSSVGRVQPGQTPSTLRQSASRRNTEHPSPECSHLLKKHQSTPRRFAVRFHSRSGAGVRLWESVSVRGCRVSVAKCEQLGLGWLLSKARFGC